MTDSREEPLGEGDTFEVVARSLQAIEIETLRARLAAEGIESFVADAGINQAIALGSVRLLVARERAAEARKIVELVRSGRFALGDDEAPE